MGIAAIKIGPSKNSYLLSHVKFFYQDSSSRREATPGSSTGGLIQVVVSN